MDAQGTLYQQVASRVERLIEGGTLSPGARIPSVRRLSRQLSVSISTVLEAYRLLEDRRLIEARPQSGYYVRAAQKPAPRPRKTVGIAEPIDLERVDLGLALLEESNRRDVLPFGAAIPHSEFLPVARLNRILARVVREDPATSQSYDSLEGNLRLRVQIARRLMEAGCSLMPDDIVTTSGASEAMQLALRAVTRPGDCVAIESPCYYGLLHTLESLHLLALEVGTDPDEGMCLDELEAALRRKRVRAVVAMPNFGNPLGHCMPDSRKQQLVELCSRFGTPLIEDDLYGELAHDGDRPRALRAFDPDGDTVLLISSFSKTLAPGYRVGWIVPGRHMQPVRRLKFSTSIATATPPQMAIASFLESGGFERYLRSLRRSYKDLSERFRLAIGEHFPAGTRVSQPRGGHVLWIELPRGVDSVRLHHEALAQGISVAPGTLFSGTDRYRNFVRVNCAIPWSDRVELGLRDLGRLAGVQLA
jgi:DNA-binding transcriptional MocR family regulator